MSRCRSAYSTGTAIGDLFAGTYFGGGVFRSTDNSDTWSEKNHGLITTEVRATDINASNTLVVAGAYKIGMFRSADGGPGWEKVNNGLSALYESCIAINAAGDIFWAPILRIAPEEPFGRQTTGRAGLRSIMM
jgi:photosystem II stability/assembly factor-like uncharacterized protein